MWSAGMKASWVNHISENFRKHIENIVVNNLLVIYATNPEIYIETAIKIAFINGGLNDYFSKTDLELAAKKALPNHKK